MRVVTLPAVEYTLNMDSVDDARLLLRVR